MFYRASDQVNMPLFNVQLITRVCLRAGFKMSPLLTFLVFNRCARPFTMGVRLRIPTFLLILCRALSCLGIIVFSKVKMYFPSIALKMYYLTNTFNQRLMHHLKVQIYFPCCLIYRDSLMYASNRLQATMCQLLPMVRAVPVKHTPYSGQVFSTR